ncbi:MAG: hypothetical protein JW913_12620 [Chitinispirillaceae bacterium]|nr:hypothetical protein [Chitinispirillaceae bacterium]
MALKRRQRMFLTTLFVVGATVCSLRADFFPHRICTIRSRRNLNHAWKFIKADPADAAGIDCDEASWQTVNLPHSAQYDVPTADGEQKSVPLSSGWDGVHWYRKTFYVPSATHNQKVFIEFDGAMQIARVYVNGTPVGVHDACGYTGFHFDITDAVNMTGSNTLAVKLDCRYRNDIPPGRAGTFTAAGNSIEYPDFFLYSGLYRDVWLVRTGDIYIPAHGQKIETPDAASSAARVRVKTLVQNDTGGDRTISPSFCIVNPDNAIVARCAMTGAIGSGASRTFDTAVAVDHPELWSPETPNLYRIFTKVAVDGRAVDDYVERFGFRSIRWTRQGGFFLNEKRYPLKGVCMHQEFAWVGNAVPRSRFFEEVRLAKEMGANAVRCAHYPRAPAFYNACDELGMICLPELPSWGCCGSAPYPDDFWDRMEVTAQEMVSEGYNHPSIITWGIFNEPRENFQTQFNRLNDILHQLDSTRNTCIYGASTQIPYLAADIYGMNYELYPHTSIRNRVMGSFVAEYHEGWIKWCYRGDTATKNDAALSGSLSENRFASDRWSGSNNWTQILNAWSASTQPVPGGGFMWCFVDYWSPVQDYPMGVLDHYRIPKKAFYTFRSNWTGTADDNFVFDNTPVRVRLEADLATLVADSTDITRLVGSLRDATGKCIFAAGSITLRISGPIDCFDPLTKNTIAGKIGWVLKSRNSAGDVRVIASSAGLESDTITIACVEPDGSAIPFIWPQSRIAENGLSIRGITLDKVRQTRGKLVVSFARPAGTRAVITLNSLDGKVIGKVAVKDAAEEVVITTGRIPAGIYILNAGNGAVRKIGVID